MNLSQSLLAELEHEAAATRKTLERVPEDKLEWKPHPKSTTMIALASHLASLLTWAQRTIDNDSVDVMPPGAPPPRPKVLASRAEVLAAFDKNLADARAAIARASDGELQAPWTFLIGGKTMFTLPRIAVLRSFILSHTIHHRAQLGVYLRMNDVAVPSIYGPSADEGLFGTSATEPAQRR